MDNISRDEWEIDIHELFLKNYYSDFNIIIYSHANIREDPHG